MHYKADTMWKTQSSQVDLLTKSENVGVAVFCDQPRSQGPLSTSQGTCKSEC